MSVSQWFESFCNNLQVRDSGAISTRYHAITRRLNWDFRNLVSDSDYGLYVGSYGRNTGAHPFSDLDMIFELPVAMYHQYDAYSSNGQSALLQAVKRSIDRTYSSTSIRADGQVIVVTFSDGIRFEVVPAFVNTDESYTFPNANNGGSWRVTNPRPEIKAIRERNKTCNGNLVPLCRMLRAWKREQGVPMGGLLVDTLAYQFIENCKWRDKSYLYYDWMVKDMFAWMSQQDIQQTYWRAPGSGQYVLADGPFQSKALRCYNKSVEAINHLENNRQWSAKQTWREIFGTDFPA